MESVRGAFQMPLQRRLTKMYTDTKSSYEFVKEPTQAAEIPELSTFHRKLRVQKDRLITWGLAWSDTAESPDIDESLSKAGLTDVVGSVMSTIKDILAEAEPLWQASRRPLEDKGKRIGDHKTPIVMWDRGRFEDLVWDLTSSIDTLYDLSRTRRSARHTPPMSASSSFQSPKPDASRLFESSRMLTPQQIDPSCLITDPRDPHSSILVSSPTGVFSASLRQIVYMRRPTPSTSPRKPSGSWSAVPVLLEYAAYDPVYANTGIHPSMRRFEKLFAGLQMGQDAFNRPDFGALNLVGYFEQPVHAHFGLLYELPNRFAPLDNERPSSFGLPYVTTLSDLLCNPVLEPSLELKYRLAYNISKTVFDLHSKGIMHGNLAATNIIFPEQQSPVSKGTDPLVDVNIRRAYVTSFDLFPDSAIQQPSEDVYGSSAALYKHPLDPRVTPHTVLTHESRSLDVYSLAMILLEIGVWRPLADIFPAYLPEDLSGVYKQLAARCGNRYLQAAKACWRAIDEEMSNCSRPEVPLQKVYGRVMRALESCCVPGDGLDEDDNDAREEYYKKKALALSLPSPEKQPAKLKILTNSQSKIKVSLPREATTPKAPELEVVPKPRQRIFLAVKISQEHLDYWHAVLMPQINHALRGFYRKYPESVEVSLESIGETAHKTKPTILVVCTSVSKVRSVLKRSFEYDSSTYGLLVCRGKILRSRKDRPKRSMMASETELRPANPDYQERPFSGASIGAYIEGHPLPPVSFGGLIVMDGKPYGLTVHHMLDEPEDPEDDSQATQHPTFRSSGSGHGLPNLDGESLDHSVDSDEYGYEISEFGSEFGSDTYSEGSFYSDEEQLEDDGPREPGDTEGIPQDCGRGYVVTQPAMDDVADEMYYPEEEDLLDTYGIGEIYASSGIRRRHEDGSVHEVDWALFKFIPGRLPSGNFLKDDGKNCRPGSPYPVAVAPWSKLHDLEVHCMARTTGHQTGRILPGMSIVKIFGRQTPSQSYQVSGGLGVPGDSGAWLIDKKQGLACGHVLAWSSRKRVAYICPMQILLKDIAETLDAQSVCFPNAALTETEYGDDASMEQRSALDENPPTPQQGEPLHTGIMKPSLGMRYAISPDDDIVAAMDTMQVSPSVISHG